MVATWIEEWEFAASLGINASNVIGLVPVAGDATKGKIHHVVAAAARGWHNVLDVVGRTGDDLRCATVFASGAGALLDDNSGRARDHSGGDGFSQFDR